MATTHSCSFLTPCAVTKRGVVGLMGAVMASSALALGPIESVGQARPRGDATTERVGTHEQRAALVDRILELTRAREAWSVPKEEALGYDPHEEMEAVRADVVAAETEEELYWALFRLSNARRDRHLTVEPVPDGLRVPERQALRAPVEVRTDFSDPETPSFFVLGVDPSRAETRDVRPGDRVVRVDGRTAEEYVEAFTPWTRHSSTHGLLWHLGLNLPRQSSEAPPWMYGPTLDLELERDDGETYSAALPWLPAESLEIDVGDPYPGFSSVMERINFEVLRPDDGRPIVILRWLDFEYELIQDVIDLIAYAEREDVLGHTLVIDVTSSSGGSRGAYAIQRLVSKPFRTTFGNLRLSDAAAEMIERWATEPDIEDAPDILGLNESRSWLHEWARTEGREAVRRGAEYTRPTPFKLAHLPRDSDGILRPAPVHFRGPVAIIAGPHGGSHLDQFVSMFADNDLAPVLGMPAGGYSNTWEAEEVLTLPGTDRPLALFMWNVGHTLRPNGEILEGNPVWPDVYVPLTRGNFRTYHRDLLELALREVGRPVSD